jgi:hypothetical protein
VTDELMMERTPNRMSDPMDDPRPTLFDLWKQHRFCVEEICVKYEANRKKTLAMHRTILAMLRSHPVTLAAAKQVLAAVSKALGIDASLRTVRVALLPEPVPARKEEGKDVEQPE